MGLSHFKTLEDGEESVKRTSSIDYPYQVTQPCHLFGEGISLSSCTDDYVSKESRERDCGWRLITLTMRPQLIAESSNGASPLGVG